VRTIEVALGERSYPVHVGAELLERCGELLAPLRLPRVVIVTNSVVAAHHLARLQTALSAAAIPHHAIVVADGERYKDWKTLDQIHTRLLELGADRDTALIALGGGVIGDLAGFAAATFQRGVPVIQLPTTLLAQVDSAIGGKTAINHPLGKNMIGAFHQPRAVISDSATLRTLPEREYAAGIAEVIKYGAVLDLALFEWLEASMERLVAREPDAVEHAVIESSRIKAEIVAGDEREEGRRVLLNFGHTFGHAIETATAYESWLHGEAVAAGMVMAAALSERVCGLPAAEAARLRALIARVPGLERKPPSLSHERWLGLMAQDKKARGGVPRFVLLDALGKGRLHAGATREELSRAVEASP
jgi:3-dehydroquinate synthase